MWIMNRNMADALAVAVGSDSIPANGTLKGGYLVLIVAPFNPQPTDAFSSYTEATFNGYARTHMTANFSNFRGQGGMSLAAGPTVAFELGADSTPATVYGHCVLGSDSVTLLAAEVFTNPVSLAKAGDGFLDTPVFGFNPAAGYGTSALST